MSGLSVDKAFTSLAKIINKTKNSLRPARHLVFGSENEDPNRIALKFCMAHIPIFILVAYLCQTSIYQAIIFGSLLCLGPLIASLTLENPRQLSLVYGFTSMCLGALLVHLGQGPVQIEMHFHFFASLALLTVWGNPLIIWVAAITVATHHGLFWLFLPESVFNYDASFWVVGVHALFVVAESVAASFIARNFFDNVIGLERIIQARTVEVETRNNEMKLILGNTNQGFMMVDTEGSFVGERSAIIKNWFGAPVGGEKYWDFLKRQSPMVSELTELGFEDIRDKVMPLEASLENLPNRIIKSSGHIFEIEYQKIKHKENLFLVVFTDITQKLQHESSMETQIEIVEIFKGISRDRTGFMEFIDDSKSIIKSINQGYNHLESEEIARKLHTLKGNSSVFKVSSLASVCHQIENNLAENLGKLTNSDLRILNQSWEELNLKLNEFLLEKNNGIEVDSDELKELIKKVESKISHYSITSILSSWECEPLKRRLSRMSDQARRLADRLNKNDLEVTCKDNGLRLPAKEWSGFWSILGHVIRNSVDHGIESPDERVSNGKSTFGRLTLESKIDGDELVILISDDGRGVDLSKLRGAALKKGFGIHNDERDINLIFEDGISTKNNISTVSGRGVGLSAVKDFCTKNEVKLKVESKKYLGTVFEFKIPRNSIKVLLAS